MLASRQTGAEQPVHAWLTNVHTSLLSDRDSARTASMLEHLNTLFPSHGEGTETSVEGQPALELRVGSRFDRGIERKDKPNEDSLFVTQGVLHSSSAPPRPFALFILADGMGGLINGQEASQLAIESLVEYVSRAFASQQVKPDTLLPWLKEGVEYANRQVYQYNQQHRTNMGTTVTAALVSGTTAYVVNVGDSRTYLYRKTSGLSQITRDHSLVAALVDAGIIEPGDVYTHPMRNQIYRCLGEKPRVEVDTFVVPLADGDTLLLCSDGLWEMVRDPQMASIVADPTPNPSQIASLLVQAALADGGADNVSVIVAQVKASRASTAR